MCKGVCPELFVESIKLKCPFVFNDKFESFNTFDIPASAPWARRSSTHFEWPCSTAMCNGEF